MLITLMHELCHAYLNIFVDRANFNIPRYLQMFGIGGHGLAFQDLSDTVVSVLSSSDVFDVHFDEFCGTSVRIDEEKMSSLELQADWLFHEIRPMNTNTVRTDLREKLNMSKHQANRYEKQLRYIL